MSINHLQQFTELTENFREGEIGKLLKVHTPLMASLMPSCVENPDYKFAGTGIWGFSTLFHELGHCMDFIEKGQEHRLKLNNFGFRGGFLSRASIATEIRTTVFEHALEQLMLPLNFREQNSTSLAMYDAHKILSRLYRPFEGTSSEIIKKDILRSYEKMSADYISTLLSKVDKYVFEECKDSIYYRPFRVWKYE